jgi:hypothetical protein
MGNMEETTPFFHDLCRGRKLAAAPLLHEKTQTGNKQSRWRN